MIHLRDLSKHYETTAGPETALIELVKEVAKQESGLDVKIVTFSDYAIPNVALNDESIDAPEIASAGLGIKFSSGS